jgi:hypothetical protein
VGRRKTFTASRLEVPFPRASPLPSPTALLKAGVVCHCHAFLLARTSQEADAFYFYFHHIRHGRQTLSSPNFQMCPGWNADIPHCTFSSAPLGCRPIVTPSLLGPRCPTFLPPSFPPSFPPSLPPSLFRYVSLARPPRIRSGRACPSQFHRPGGKERIGRRRGPSLSRASQSRAPRPP